MADRVQGSRADHSIDLLKDAGECGRLVAAFDWNSTPLGPLREWPAYRLQTVLLMLRSRVPIATMWGPSGVLIYNDGYAQIAANRHPAIFGVGVCEAWPEVADFNANVLKVVLGGETLSYTDVELELVRFGRSEKAWFKLDYSAVLDPDGSPAAVFAVCTETTEKVQAEKWRKSERDRQRQMFEQAPGFMAMLTGPQHVFELTNEDYRKLVGYRSLIGLTVRDAFPELAGKGFYEILDQVYATGEPFVGKAVEVELCEPDSAASRTVVIDFIYQPVRDPDGQVAGIFVHGVDVSKSHAAERALVENERRLRLAHRIAGIGAVEVDIPGRKVMGSEDFWKIWGLEPRESAPTSLLESLVLSEDASIRSSLETRADGSAAPAVEYRIRRPDTGEIRWISRHVEFVHGEDGKPLRMFGAVKDITDRREAESRQKMLAHELEHRIKNLLAMVGAIAARTLRNADLDTAREAFLQRLRAMSEAHGMITESRWRGVSMRQVTEATLQIYPADQISISGPALSLEPRLSLTLALAVNELATNAVKYGALSRPEGRVSIDWTLSDRGEDPERGLVWRWQELYGPPVVISNRRGFGSFLVERVFGTDFGGSVKLDMRPEGLVCTLTAPAPGLAPAFVY